jgi:hypothetical protein
MGVLCAGLVVWNFRLRAKVAALTEQALVARSDLEAAHRKLPPVGDRSSSSKRSAMPPKPGESPDTESGASIPTPPAGAAGATAKSESKRRVNTEDFSAMVKSPIMQKIMASQTSAVMQMTYDRLMNHFELSPEERDYFQRLLVEKQSNIQNLGMQFMNPALTNDERQALGKKIEEALKTGEEKIRTFLNDDGDFAYYQTYSGQEPERMEIGMFESSLEGSDALDAATSDALAVLQNEARKKFPFTVDFYDHKNFGNVSALNTPSVQKFLEEQSEFQSQVAAKAADMLTPAQLQVFKQNQAAVRQMTSMQMTSIVQMAGGR